MEIKTKSDTTNQTCTHNKTYDNIFNTKKLKPGLVAFYDIRPGNGMGLLSKNCIRKKVNKQEKT